MTHATRRCSAHVQEAETDAPCEKARGPSPSASSVASAKELRNPQERFFSEWVEEKKKKQTEENKS